MVIDQRFGRGMVLQEAINAILPSAYEAAVVESKTIPLGAPEVYVTRLEDAVAAEPTSIGARMFRAMILHDAGRATEGLRGLLEVVAAESSDADVQRHRRSLTAYAAELGDRGSP